MTKATVWLPWLLGAALLAGVIFAALRFSEAGELLRLAQNAHPWWLALAVLLQAASYLAEGQGWRAVARAGGTAIPIRLAYRLSLTKLFVDQALPSAGISGTMVFAKSLESHGLPRPIVTAAVVLDLVSYYFAYVTCLVAALVIAVANAQIGGPVVVIALLFVLFGVSLTAVVMVAAGRGNGSLAPRLRKLRPVRALLSVLEDADRGLTRSPRLLLETTACQIGVFLLDAATLWVLVLALGVDASPAGVFASYMLATLFRTLGIVPAGLGTFEATAVLTLSGLGLDLPVALGATLLFRGLSFWLPLPVGLWLTHAALRPAARTASGVAVASYWTLAPDEVLTRLDTSRAGLSEAQATERRRAYGANALRVQKPVSRRSVFLAQLKSPLVLLLLFAALVSLATSAWIDAGIVVAIVAVGAGLGFAREYSAQSAAAALAARVRTRAEVLRDGKARDIDTRELVPGDVVLLAAGSLVPADALVLEATDCHVSEAVLTGESFPVKKTPGPVAAEASLGQRTGVVFLGTNVRSGSARCVVVATGLATEFGAIAHRLSLRPPETEFERGIRRFGTMLTTAMAALVLVVFAVHVLGGRPAIETLLFAIALAVGLSPELLPAILSVNLARGARMMARRGVLVRHLSAIENLGSMDVLCTDKTGTITEGVVEVDGAWDPRGVAAPAVLELAVVNAALETGLANPLDEALLKGREPDLSGLEKLAEVPFDFVRKRVSVIVRTTRGVRLIVKGAIDHVLEVCTSVAGAPLDDATRERLYALHAGWAAGGVRCLAVATRELDPRDRYGREDEHGLALEGFVTFLDRPKAGVTDAIADLGRLGVAVKLITGDNRLVAQHIAGLVGLRSERVLTGRDLELLHDEALWHAAERTDIFAEVDPNQKERIILSLKKMGHVVGFLGDGVNDAPAMHAADTSLSVQSAVDVAREAADFVLLEPDLRVIRAGIEEGRRTFANTLKYLLTTTSANLGNMVSMAFASLFLSFLPLTAGQILLNNFLSDVPAFGLAGDSVDPDMVARPRRWNMRSLARFMLQFGLLSSAFDFLTFGALLIGFGAHAALFRTGWFVESLLTELVIAMVVRTRGPFYRSRPGRWLLVATVVMVVVTLALPYLPSVDALGFVPLPPLLALVVVGITIAYVLAAEITKHRFYRSPEVW